MTRACYKKVNIQNEIRKQKNEKPKIMINLHTLSNLFKIHKKDLICGYQLNKIKFILEKFLNKLAEFGAELVSVFQKAQPNDEEFLGRRLDDYKNGQQLIKNIEKIQNLDKLKGLRRLCSKIPFNIMITLCINQSAEKFGKLYGFDLVDAYAAIESANLANKLGSQWILGLSTFKFVARDNWKIWSDEKLDMEKMTVVEIDKDVIMEHLKLNYQNAALFIVLGDTLRTEHNVKQKTVNHFGSLSKIPSIAKIVNEFNYALTEEAFKKIAEKKLGANYEPKFIDDLKKLLEHSSIESEEEGIQRFDAEVTDLIQNDFITYAQEVLLNKTPIFASPVFLDLNSPDMENFNLLILLWIQKTVGILLKCIDDKEPRKVFVLEDHDGKFNSISIDAVYPDFDVPFVKTLLTSQLSTFESYFG